MCIFSVIRINSITFRILRQQPVLFYAGTEEAYVRDNRLESVYHHRGFQFENQACVLDGRIDKWGEKALLVGTSWNHKLNHVKTLLLNSYYIKEYPFLCYLFTLYLPVRYTYLIHILYMWYICVCECEYMLNIFTVILGRHYANQDSQSGPDHIFASCSNDCLRILDRNRNNRVYL